MFILQNIQNRLTSITMLFIAVLIGVVSGGQGVKAGAVCSLDRLDECGISVDVTSSITEVVYGGNADVSFTISALFQYGNLVSDFDVWMVDNVTSDRTDLSWSGTFPTRGGTRTVNTGPLTNSVTVHAAVMSLEGSDDTSVVITVLPPPTGTINVSSSIPNAPFSISGPIAVAITGTTNASGTASFSDKPLGTYTITWGTVTTGYTKPGTSSKTLSSSGPITFSGTYTSALGGTIGTTSCGSGSVSVAGTAWDTTKSPIWNGPWVQVRVAPDSYASVSDYEVAGGFTPPIVMCRPGSSGNTNYTCSASGLTLPATGGMYAEVSVLNSFPGTVQSKSIGEVHISCPPSINVHF